MSLASKIIRGREREDADINFFDAQQKAGSYGAK